MFQEDFNTIKHKHITSTLSSLSLFYNFSNDEISHLLMYTDAKIQSFDKNEFVFRENTIYKNLCILISGEVILYKSDEYGNRNIIDIIKNPRVFAEVFSFTSSKKSPVTAHTNMDTILVVINTEKLTSIDDDYDKNNIALRHRLSTNLLNVFANKNLILLSKIEVISRRNIKEKIIRFLELEQKKSNKTIFSIPYNRQEMADFLGVDRSALSRELSRLKEEGIIDFDKNLFKILEQ